MSEIAAMAGASQGGGKPAKKDKKEKEKKKDKEEKVEAGAATVTDAIK